MPDTFQTMTSGLDSPAVHHYTVTPGAGDLPFIPRAIYCGAGGTATIVDVDGTSVTYTLVAGQILPLRATKVTAATATLIAWY